MNIISTYIIILIRHLELLLKKKALLSSIDIYTSSASSLPKQNQRIIEIYKLRETLRDLTNIIESSSKNNYQFTKHCEKHFDYNSPEEILLSSYR